jgi:hypothetical protein
MSAPQPALTPDFAVAQRESMLQGLERELEVTKKVLSAVPDSNRDFHLDPKITHCWGTCLAPRLQRRADAR